jgi:hypothetical protein
MRSFVNAPLERRLAVVTSWASFGTFGLCFALSGFAATNLAAGVLGFALLVLGFVAHTIINYVFDADFTRGEAALGFVIFVLAVLVFVGSWIVAPNFGGTQAAIGLLGFAAITASFVIYMITRHGIREAFRMFDRIRDL